MLCANRCVFFAGLEDPQLGTRILLYIHEFVKFSREDVQCSAVCLLSEKSSNRVENVRKRKERSSHMCKNMFKLQKKESIGG